MFVFEAWLIECFILRRLEIQYLHPKQILIRHSRLHKTQSEIEKDACKFKSRGNRKQFEFNASVDAILTDIASKPDSPDEVKSLANEEKEKIRKVQKLVKLADRN